MYIKIFKFSMNTLYHNKMYNNKIGTVFAALTPLCRDDGNDYKFLRERLSLELTALLLVLRDTFGPEVGGAVAMMRERTSHKECEREKERGVVCFSYRQRCTTFTSESTHVRVNIVCVCAWWLCMGMCQEPAERDASELPTCPAAQTCDYIHNYIYRYFVHLASRKVKPDALCILKIDSTLPSH